MSLEMIRGSVCLRDRTTHGTWTGGLRARRRSTLLTTSGRLRDVRGRSAHHALPDRRDVQGRPEPQNDARRLRFPVPSALDNRPLKFEGVRLRQPRWSASRRRQGLHGAGALEQIVEQIIRRTGLVDRTEIPVLADRRHSLTR